MSEILSAKRRAELKEANAKTVFGFWVYLMTDCVLFATLFATFVVLRNNTFGGPAGNELFSLPFVLTETLVLLTSSFTAGLGLLAARRYDRQQVAASSSSPCSASSGTSWILSGSLSLRLYI
jgi:heme/copper-type cytochrome/quinol oxidase subunit 3